MHRSVYHNLKQNNYVFIALLTEPPAGSIRYYNYCWQLYLSADALYYHKLTQHDNVSNQKKIVTLCDAIFFLFGSTRLYLLGSLNIMY
jgi:hypothetical protein